MWKGGRRRSSMPELSDCKQLQGSFIPDLSVEHDRRVTEVARNE